MNTNVFPRGVSEARLSRWQRQLQQAGVHTAEDMRKLNYELRLLREEKKRNGFTWSNARLARIG